MSKTSVLISCLAVVIGGLVYWVLSADEKLVPIPVHNEDIKDQNTNTIAYQWQWENFTETKTTGSGDRENSGKDSETDKPRPVAEVPYDVVKIYTMLQNIRLDENGLVVPDQTAKEALENGFLELGPDLSPEAMTELQDLIRIGLPGEAGEKAARIMENYYQLRLAEDDFNQQREDQLSITKVNQLPSIDGYEELVQLRRSYLGDEIADKLFAVEDAQARHMFAAIATQQNKNLTDEEKQSQQEALQDKLNDRLLALGQLEPEEAAAESVRRLRNKGASSDDIYSTREAILGSERARDLAAIDREEAQWQNSFSGFWQARENVKQASLDEAESERQIEELLAQHFSPEERERARLTTFEWQAKE